MSWSSEEVKLWARVAGWSIEANAPAAAARRAAASQNRRAWNPGAGVTGSAVCTPMDSTSDSTADMPSTATACCTLSVLRADP